MQKSMTVKTVASSAMLAAISIVMARLLSYSTPEGVRWSLDKFPLFLAGMLFGPLMGGMTGFVADLIGSILQFGFNPFLCPPAILYGVFGGLFRWFLVKKFNWFRLGIAYMFPVFLGSVLYQSCALAWFYFSGTLREGIIYYLSTRAFQFSIIMVAEVFIIATLVKMNVFTRIGLWPPVKRERKSSE